MALSLFFIASFCLHHPEESGGPTSCPAGAPSTGASGREGPCSPVRSPPATWGCRWWDRSGRERGFGVFFSFNSAVSVRAGCWVKRRSWRCFSALVIRHEPKPPSALSVYVCGVHGRYMYTGVSIDGCGAVGSPLCFRAEAAPGDVLVGIKPLFPHVGSGQGCLWGHSVCSGHVNLNRRGFSLLCFVGVSCLYKK